MKHIFSFKHIFHLSVKVLKNFSVDQKLPPKMRSIESSNEIKKKTTTKCTQPIKLPQNIFFQPRAKNSYTFPKKKIFQARLRKTDHLASPNSYTYAMKKFLILFPQKTNFFKQKTFLISFVRTDKLTCSNFIIFI